MNRSPTSLLGDYTNGLYLVQGHIAANSLAWQTAHLPLAAGESPTPLANLCMDGRIYGCIKTQTWFQKHGPSRSERLRLPLP